jgi:long-chain acyl-CoA synthetase
VLGHPRANANIAEYLRESAARDPHGCALVDGATRLTWSELDARATRFAAGLVRHGLHAGDRVGMLLGNSADYVVAFYGALRAGLCVVPMNPAYTAPEVAVLVSDAGVRLLLAGEQTVSVANDAVGAVHSCEVVLVDSQAWRELADTTAVLAEVSTSGDSLALLLFTAGTSGRPKGAMLTHGALRANTESLLSLDSPAAVHPGDVVLAVLPMFHVYGLNTVLNLSVAAGATLVIVDRFDPVDSLRLVVAESITTIAGAPAMYQAWLRVPGLREAVAGVRLLSSGGAPLPPAVYESFADATGKQVFEGYGMTECSPVVATTLVDGRPRPGSVGLTVPGVEVRLVDDSGQDVDDGDPGEVWVRGASVFRGYWPDGAGGPDAHGWFRSGDIAYAEEDGALHLVDRRREVILVNGFNVYPREIELVIESMPEVAEVAVLGIPDDVTGEGVLALVVPRMPITADDVLAFCSTRLARFKTPSVIRVVDSLPHSAAGKVAKGRLRDVYGDVDGTGPAGA